MCDIFTVSIDQVESCSVLQESVYVYVYGDFLYSVITSNESPERVTHSVIHLYVGSVEFQFTLLDKMPIHVTKELQ